MKVVIAYLAIILFFGIGWVLNIVDIIRAMNDPITGEFIMHVVGIFIAPLGSIMGWFF